MAHSPWTRRTFLSATAGAALGGGLLRRPRSAASAAPTSVFTVDFARVLSRVSPQSLGVGCTTYGRTPLGSEEQAQAEAALDFRYVRLPVGVREGRVTSSAGGGPRDLDAARLARWYQERGARIVAVLGGRTNDVDIAPGDAEAIARAFIAAKVDLDGVEFSSPNEPGNQKWTLDQTLEASLRLSDELRRVRPGLLLQGPEWAWFGRDALKKWAAGMGERCGGILFHHYAMGEKSLPTEQAMRETPRWGQEVLEARSDLRALGLPERVGITELNFSWRYQDGTPPQGRNERFFSGVNTVWSASVLGHILEAGGSGAIYGTQNGPLGVFVQSGEHDHGRPASSPMPAYWGLAAWTGAKLFPHFGDRMHPVTRQQGEGGAEAGREVELFACSNEAGGSNLVAINKGEREQAFAIRLLSRAKGTLDAWQTDAARPFDAPRLLRRGVAFESEISIALPAMTVAIIVLSRPRP